MFHRDFPCDAQEVWEVIAKALMLRTGAAVVISFDELRSAAATQAELGLDKGSLILRREMN